jgi:hypothetical protein
MLFAQDSMGLLLDSDEFTIKLADAIDAVVGPTGPIGLGGVATPGYRLTLVTGTPVLVNDISLFSTIFWTPWIHDQTPYFDGNVWTTRTPGELRIDLDATNFVASKHYDVFYFNDGTDRIGYGPDWSQGLLNGNNTVGSAFRGSGAGSTELQRVNGRWMNKNAITLRWSASGSNTILANQALYIGTAFATGNGQVSMLFNPTAASGGTSCVLHLYNAYNRVPMKSVNKDNVSSYALSSGVWQRINNSSANSIQYVDGLKESVVRASATAAGFINLGASVGATGVYYTAIKANWSSGESKESVGIEWFGQGAADQWSGTCTPFTMANFAPLLGCNQIDYLELGGVSAGATVTVYGSGWSSVVTQSIFTTLLVDM